MPHHIEFIIFGSTLHQYFSEILLKVVLNSKNQMKSIIIFPFSSRVMVVW